MMSGDVSERSKRDRDSLVQPLLAAALVVLALALLFPGRLGELNLLRLAQYWPVCLIAGAVAALLGGRDRR